MAAGLTAVLLWVAAVEVPDRLGRIGEVRAETTFTWDRHERALDQREALARLRGEQTRLEDRLASIAGGERSGTSPSAMLDRIGEAIDDAGLTLLEMRPLEGESGTAYARLPIQLRLAGSFEGLRSFLRRIETGAGAMPVREVSIRGSESSSAAVEAAVVLEVVVVERTYTTRGSRP